jgi:iron(III) transport system ATP-binding protein
MEFLEVAGAGKQTEDRWLLAPLSFTLKQGTRLAIVGETGSGKSTLLKLMAGLLQPDAGAIFFEGKKVPGPLEQLIPGHKHMAYLSQHYELRNNYVVHDYLDYGSQMTEAEAHGIFELCRISHLLTRKTNSGLSGGEKQRIALAKLLLTKPKLLLLDEPFSNMDAHHKAQVKAILLQLEKSLGVQSILVSHEARDVLSWADRLLVLQQGKLVQDDDPRTVYFKPKNAYVAGLLGAFNAIPQQATGQHLFLRPSQITLNANGDGLAARVTQVQFLGDNDLLEAIDQGQSYWVQTACGTHSVGDTVVLSWPQTNNWYI